MFSVTLDKTKKMLTIQLPLEKPRISASGKTLLIGSTHGLRTGEAMHRGQPVVVVANAFVYPEPEPNTSARKPKRRSKPRSSGRGELKGRTALVVG